MFGSANNPVEQHLFANHRYLPFLNDYYHKNYCDNKQNYDMLNQIMLDTLPENLWELAYEITVITIVYDKFSSTFTPNHMFKWRKNLINVQNKLQQIETSNSEAFKSLASIMYHTYQSHHTPKQNDLYTASILEKAVDKKDVDTLNILFNFFSCLTLEQFNTIFYTKYGDRDNTIIQKAVVEGNLATVECLITEYCKTKRESGSLNEKINLKLKEILSTENRDNKSSMDVAFANCHDVRNKDNENMFKYLLQYGDLRLDRPRDKKKATENIQNIFDASFDIFKGIMNTLLENGSSGRKTIKALLDTPNQYGSTILHKGVLLQSEEVVKCLIDLGAVWTNCNNNDESPMCIAIKNNDLDIVKLLLTSSKCNINTQQGKHKVTALHYATGYSKSQLPDNIQLSPETIETQIEIIK
ncbi:ankyrin repeat domain-containing protein [Candidatus Cardinium hertigii]|uniref:ankyrin repeat domain-containing protein n=1 Tax=Candidatus Cardinium hertigii TaxID=247481 RepID=UPI003D7E4C4D